MSNIDIIFSTFKDLSPYQVQDLLRLRQQTFIIEQSCFYEDIDGDDPKARHLLIYEDDTLAGYLRLFEPGIKFEDSSSLGRIVVNKSHRGSEIGRKLIQVGIKYAIQLYPKSPIKIEAQAALNRYYTKYGFKEIGDKYIVDDIPHQLMILVP